MIGLPSRLLVVTDRKLAGRPLEQVVADALRGGAQWIWFRDRDLPWEERRALGGRLLRMCAEAGATLSIGGSAGQAAAMGATACHLPAGGNPREARAVIGSAALIGVSAHALEDVVRAGAQGADYVTLSPIYESASKPGYGPALGVGSLGAAKQLAVPIVALGGIDPERAGECFAAGAQAVGVMGAIMAAPCVEAAVSAFVLHRSERPEGGGRRRGARG